MKIAMILDSEFPPDPRVENEALTLINSGHKVYLFCITYHDNEGSEEYKGISINRVKVPKMVRSVSALAYTTPIYHFILKKVFSRVLNIDEFDAIHIHDIQSARTFFELLENKKIMRVLDLHENRPEIMKYYEHVNSLLGKVLINPNTWKKFEEKYIAKADKVIVVTASAKEYYKSIYNESEGKFVVVPNSVNRSFIEKHDTDVDQEFIEKYKDNFVILYLGNTGERRGIGDVLETINLLKVEIPKLKFLCVGSSKSDTKWQEMVSKLNLEEHVDLLGWQDFEKFPTFLKASDI
ncbi:MAG: glycosyltransferase family 4 protein, partial [Candidatus Paceibacterota bacterium]